jgi:hypothetical protein
VSIMHVFSMADANNPWDPGAQFRSHHNIPWDEAYELYFDADKLHALVVLARAAQDGAPTGLKGRVFDVMRAAISCAPQPGYERRDRGPYAMATPSAIWTRIEFVDYLRDITLGDWQKAHDTGQMILKLARTLE